MEGSRRLVSLGGTKGRRGRRQSVGLSPTKQSLRGGSQATGTPQHSCSIIFICFVQICLFYWIRWVGVGYVGGRSAETNTDRKLVPTWARAPGGKGTNTEITGDQAEPNHDGKAGMRNANSAWTCLKSKPGKKLVNVLQRCYDWYIFRISDFDWVTGDKRW